MRWREPREAWGDGERSRIRSQPLRVVLMLRVCEEEEGLISRVFPNLDDSVMKVRKQRLIQEPVWEECWLSKPG